MQDPSKSKVKSEDAAFNADVPKNGRGKKKCFDRDCNNCGQFSHRDTDFWDEGGGKEGQAPKGWKLHGKKTKDLNSKDSGQNSKGKSLVKVNTAAEETKEPDSIWLAEPVEDEDPTSSSLSYATLVQDNSAVSNKITELYNSGASQHMSSARTCFVDFVTIPPKPIQSADNHTFNAISRGNLYVHLPNGKKRSRILLKDVLYAPSMRVTLISISHLASAGYAALFCNQLCSIYTVQKNLVGSILLVNGLYCIRNQYPTPFAGTAKAKQVLTMDELYARLSHIGAATICDMLAKGMVTRVKLHPSHTTMGQCKACKYGKATRKPIGKDREPKRCEKFGDEVHTDVWGPSPTQTPAKKTYYVTFTNNHMWYMHQHLMAVKSDTFDAYRQYEAWAKNQRSASIKCL